MKTKVALLIYQIWDYKIKLKLGKELMIRTIYILLQKKLKILQKYFKKNLKKEFIK